MPPKTTAALRPDGPAYDVIDGTLRAFAEYRSFRAGELPRADYCAWLQKTAAVSGLNQDQLNLSARFPLDERRFVADSLDRLVSLGLLPDTGYPEEEFGLLWKAVQAKLWHGGFMTYIFPEEARLLFAIAHIVRPRTLIFPGSYYAYWAVWALPAIAKANGSATLIDIDRRAVAVARHNVEQLGMGNRVSFVDSDAIAYGRTLQEADLVVLDAEGPKNEGPDELRDKAIYAPIMEATTPALRPGCLLVAHNMLLENLTDNPYFAARVAYNKAQYARFQAHLDAHYDRQCVLPTSEGIGVYRKAEA